MKNFRKSIAGFLIVVGVLFFVLPYLWDWSQVVCWWRFISTKEHVLEIATFIITAFAFLTAGFAFVWQHKSLEHQKEAGVKQEIIGAWQVLANKAAGNSGKIEAIEFLAKQERSLQGIDMSKKTHGGQVYLQGLNVSEKELGKKVDLIGSRFEGAYLYDAHFEGARLSGAHFEGAILYEAHFEGADLYDAHFEGANLQRAHFEGADLYYAHFEGADLYDAHFEGDRLWFADFEGADLQEAHFEGARLLEANFEGADLWKAHFEGARYLEQAIFKDSYISFNDKKYLPSTLESDRFKFDFILNDDGEKKSAPHLNKEGKPTGRTKYFIQLVQKTQNS
jgi:uncharacterized protein YjbI with pentapeptide repeats